MDESSSILLKKNAKIAALFLFQYSLLIPLMRYIGASRSVAISGIVLLSIIFLANKKLWVNKRVALSIILIIALMMLKTLYDGSDIKVLVNFCLISFPAILVYSYEFDAKAFIEYSTRLAVVNFGVLVWTPFFGHKIAYMRFGYGMVLTTIFIYNALWNKQRDEQLVFTFVGYRFEKLFLVIIFIISLVETVLYGSRGALITFLAFVLIDRLLVNRKKMSKWFFFVPVCLVSAINLERILELLVSIADKLGIQSYAIHKYQYQLQYGLSEASSGRVGLYERAFTEMLNKPFLGNPMVYYDEGQLYVHNLLLQVGRDMGIIAMIVLLGFLLYCISVLATKRRTYSERRVVAVVFCMSVVRLLISSNIWERPEFWILLCIVLGHQMISGTESCESVLD